MKAAHELVDKPRPHRAFPVASTGQLDGSNVPPQGLHRLRLNASARQTQQRQDFLHAHAQLVRGHLLIPLQPRDILLGALTQMMQQMLQTPTGPVCEVAMAFHNIAIEHGGLSNSKKEFFTFVRVLWT
jgi:hypothetical protein